MINFSLFKKLIFEAEDKDKVAVVAFGRLNPPTKGHLKLMNKLVELAKKYKGKAILFTSHSQDPKKNPLQYKDKLEYITSEAPDGLNVADTNAKTVFQMLEVLSKLHFTSVYFVAGSDRLQEYKRLEKYAPELGIRHYEVVSAGERDPDSDDVSGMSASKLRKYASDGNFEEFKKGALCTGARCKQLYNDVRKGMNLE